MPSYNNLPSPTDLASGLIRSIRTAHGFEDDQSTPAPAFLELRGKLERALERLSSDLYNKKTHFLLEFIQNADDNAYADGVTPTLHLRIEDRLVLFECNELGFSADNVKAICDIGASTKTREKSTRGFIGEKGIGFKSVFTIADQVHITSGPYSFHFDKNAPLGMITPVLGTMYPTKRGWTTFHLHLAPTENGKELSTQLRDVRPTLLLFLRQLRALDIAVPDVPQNGAIQVQRIDGPGDDEVTLERIEAGGEYKVERVPGREGVQQSEIVLAFPVTENHEPVMEKQDVHAFLPLRCYGFNADFITSASREDILEQNSWNVSLRGSIVDTFLLAVSRFAEHPILRNVWFRYLPGSIADSFFCSLSTSDGHILHRLGVRDMTNDEFLAGLAIMDRAEMFGAQSDVWHTNVATCILRLPKPTIIGTAVHAEVLPLRILPLRNGTWAPAFSASRFTFPPAGVNIPDDLDLQSIAPGISAFSPRYQLFVRLGVTKPTLYRLRTNSVRLGPADRRCASMRLRLVDERGEAAQGDELYLDIPGVNGALSLRDALSPAVRFLHPDYFSSYPNANNGNDVSGEDDDEANANEVGDTRNEWLEWLRDRVGLNDIPRVLNGHLDPDLLDSASGPKGRELLLSLRAWWPRLAQRLTETGARALGAISIAGRRLDTLYLRRGALARAGEALELPCVPVDDPEDRAWDFLAQLGVATRMNASLFVNKLLHMQGRGEKDGEAVEEIYKQLDARFDEDETFIRNAFNEHPIILVFVNSEEERLWLRKTDVFWHGPPSMTSKAIISRSYPRLSNFFFHKLGITNAPSYALVDELRLIERRWQRMLIPIGVQEHVADILADISDIIKEDTSNVPPSLSTLAEIPVFPVSVPAEGIFLRGVGAFYVPDRSGKYADVFRERVGLLALPDSVPIARIRPLLESDIFKDKIRYLESEVTKRSVPQGRRVLDSDATELYSSRVEYVTRLVYHNNKSDLPPQQAKMLAKLRKINVISVQSITTTLSLGPCKETTLEDVSCEETDDKFTVFVSLRGSSGRSINPSVCRALSRRLDVDFMSFFACIASTVDTAPGHARLPTPVIVVPERTSPSPPPAPAPVPAPTLATAPTLAPAPAPAPSSSPAPASGPSPPSPPLRSPTEVPVHEAEQDRFPPLGTGPSSRLRRSPSLSSSTSSSFRQSPLNGRQRRRSRAQSSVGVSEHSQFMQPIAPGMNVNNNGTMLRETGMMGRLATQAGAFLNGHSMVPGGGPGGPVWNLNNMPMGTDETDLVGIMGEHFVYKLLVRMLDDFGPDNWTSELRHHVPGFTPFRGQAYADFTYLDSQGQLTRAWFGPEKAAGVWQGRWPKYHIEVKSTRGEENEPFHGIEDRDAGTVVCGLYGPASGVILGTSAGTTKPRTNYPLPTIIYLININAENSSAGGTSLSANRLKVSFNTVSGEVRKAPVRRFLLLMGSSNRWSFTTALINVGIEGDGVEEVEWELKEEEEDVRWRETR
ncbi:hypothetical protein B0F90DRAFT_1667473 [Multifurca ochricompacta]|uniref:Uncharacterized protein n=1 Tax=Multifurca ochricompacta TaxID=376703 RepID=A0AAD4M5V9_9AGAM|nr:hypothetical protein B0F90DRAFT_1667473 [Multifurca ochricompacta]